MSWLYDTTVNTFSRGISTLNRGAKAAAKTVAITTAALIATDASDNPLHVRANNIVYALANETTVGKDIGFKLADGRTTPDEVSFAAQLDEILLDITHPNGRINHNSAILNNKAAIEKLIEITQNTEKYKPESKLPQTAAKILSKLIDHAATRGGLLSTACPEMIKELVTNFTDEKDQESKLRKHTAIINFLVEITKKNKNQNTSEAVSEYLSQVDRYFHGQVGQAMTGLFKKSIHEFLVDPSSLLNNPDLNLDLDKVNQLTRALGGFFESNVPPKFRSDELVVLAKKLIEASEAENRDFGEGQIQEGLNQARTNFVNALFETSLGIQVTEAQAQSLKKERDSIELSIKHKTETLIHRDFCSPEQIRGNTDEYIFTAPDAGNLQKIGQKIRNLITEASDKEVAFQKSKIAIGHALEVAGSPFGPESSGLLNLFFDRLLGNIESQKLNDAERNFAELLFGITEDGELDIDLDEISKPDYGSDFTGIKKHYLNLLRQKRDEYQRLETQVELHKANIGPELQRIDDEYWNPLKASIPLDQIIDPAFTAGFITRLDAFSNNSPLKTDVKNKIDEINIKTQRTLDLLIYKKDNEFVINDAALKGLGLTPAKQKEIVDQLNAITTQANLNKATDGKYAPKISEFTNAFGTVMQLLREENPNLELMTREDFPESESKELAVLLKDENTTYLDLLKRLSTIVQQEKSALTSNLDFFETKLTDVVLNSGIAHTMRVSDLYNNIERAQYFRGLEIGSNSNTSISKIMLDPTHEKYEESWKKELLLLRNNSKSVSVKLKDDLDELGLNAQGAEKLHTQLQSIIEDFSFSDTDNFQGFAAAIKSWVQSLIQFLVQFKEGK